MPWQRGVCATENYLRKEIEIDRLNEKRVAGIRVTAHTFPRELSCSGKGEEEFREEGGRPPMTV